MFAEVSVARKVYEFPSVEDYEYLTVYIVDSGGVFAIALDGSLGSNSSLEGIKDITVEELVDVCSEEFVVSSNSSFIISNLSSLLASSSVDHLSVCSFNSSLSSLHFDCEGSGACKLSVLIVNNLESTVNILVEECYSGEVVCSKNSGCFCAVGLGVYGSNNLVTYYGNVSVVSVCTIGLVNSSSFEASDLFDDLTSFGNNVPTGVDFGVDLSSFCASVNIVFVVDRTDFSAGRNSIYRLSS